MDVEWYFVRSYAAAACHLLQPDVPAWACGECGRPLPSVASIDVQVVTARLPRLPMTFVWGVGVGLASHEILEELGWDVAGRNLHLGSVSDRDGRKVDGWATYNGVRHLLVRGSQDATMRVCPSCGRVIYFAQDDAYVTPAPDPSIEIYHTYRSGLVVRSDIAARLGRKTWKKVSIERLAVLEEPLDGLGALDPEVVHEV